jgi:hypothetical protein
VNPLNFLNEIRRIFWVAFVQKFVVIVLRAAWIGGAVYIFCWGSHQLWGWFPRQGLWIVYAALSAIAILASMLRHIKPDRRFVWRVDRKFKLDEQVYTAFERVQAEAGDDLGTQMLLESDAVARLPKIRRQITGRNGQLRREIESTLVVLILLLIMYVAGIGSIDRIPFPSGLGFLPPLFSEPQSRDIFQSGIPGDETQPDDENGQDRPDPAPEESSADFDLSPICDPNQMLDQAAWQQTQDLLAQLGERLCCGSATLLLSDALKYQDYAAAGDQFSVMAEKIVDYSDQTRQLLADQFLTTSVQLEQIGQQAGSMAFSEVTSALLGDSYAEMAEGLDGLALLMRQYQTQQRCMSLAIWQPGGQLLPAPSNIDPNSLQIFSESVDFLGTDSMFSETQSTVTGTEGGLPSYQVPMEDADVVSSYFSPD